MVVGPTGTGKSNLISVLFNVLLKTYNLKGECFIINPKILTK